MPVGRGRDRALVRPSPSVGEVSCLGFTGEWMMKLWEGPWTMRRVITIAIWIVCCLHVAANVEVYALRRRAGLPFRLLP